MEKLISRIAPKELYVRPNMFDETLIQRYSPDSWAGHLYWRYLVAENLYKNMPVIRQISSLGIFKNSSKILSLGAGSSIFELTLGFELRANNIECQITSTDIETKRLRELESIAPEWLKLCYLDFSDKDMLTEFISTHKPDVVFFSGSSYALTDEQLKDCLSTLKRAGIEYVIDMQVGTLSIVALAKHILMRFIDKKIDRSPSLIHGYARRISVYKNIYAKAGYTCLRTEKLAKYPYFSSQRLMLFRLI